MTARRSTTVAFAAWLCAVGIQPDAGAQERVFRSDETYYVPAGKSAIRGPSDALVTIVEFSDFRCGACRTAQRTMQQIVSLYAGEVRFAYKNFVIFGDQSVLASMAAAAAGEQGQFWAMHDRIFTGGTDIDRDLLDGYARDLGLDMGRFRAAMDAKPFPWVNDLIEEMKLGETLGVQGTPMFFVNGKPINGAADAGAFIRVIDDEVKRATRELEAGVTQADLYERLIAGGRREAGTTHPVGIGENGLTRGPADALVTLVVFEDFQCSFCAGSAGVLDQLTQEMGDDLRIVFRHMPLAGIHPDAPLAHEAAQEAAAQGKFWAMHDELFAHQDALDREHLEVYAKRIGLDMKRFRRALDREIHAAAIAADYEAAADLGVRGTPTAFINGVKVSGAQPIEVYRAMVDAKKLEAEALVRAGTPRADVYKTLVGID